MDADYVREHFNREGVVQEYKSAADKIGLWRSEQAIFTEYFWAEHNLLELGCGAGRIAFGLWELGYQNITASDFALNMLLEAYRLNKVKKTGVKFQHADATDLRDVSCEVYDGAIFGFNGLMQIPRRENRFLAMKEVFRVLKPGAHFIFTAHDRANPYRAKYWEDERKLWYKGQQSGLLHDYGDLFYDTPYGKMFIHVPDEHEIMHDTEKAGFEFVKNPWRYEIANENREVMEFSDECRFYVVKKPSRMY